MSFPHRTYPGPTPTRPIHRGVRESTRHGSRRTHGTHCVWLGRNRTTKLPLRRSGNVSQHRQIPLVIALIHMLTICFLSTWDFL